MGDYPGNPASYPANINLIDDSDPPDAAHFDLGPEALADRTAWLAARRLELAATSRSMAANFPSGLLAFPFTTEGAPAWDKANGRWLIGKNTALVEVSYDGLTWTQLGASLSANVTALFVRPTDGVAVAIKASNSTIAALDPTADAWSESTGPSWVAGGLQAGTWFAGPSLFIAWESRPSANERLYSASDGVHWNADMGSQFPANFGHNGSQVFSIISAQSTTRLLLFSTRANFASYVYTDDGATFTTQAIPTLAAGEQVVGAAYDSAAGLFTIIVSTTTGSRVLSSPTGLVGSWTVISTHATEPAQGLVSIAGHAGSVLATIFLTRGTAIWRAVLSVDGGLTWHFARLAPLGAATGFLHAEEGGQGTHLLYADAALFAASLDINVTPTITF